MSETDRIHGLNFRTQLERVEIDRTGNCHALTTPFYGLGCGTIRIYGLGAFQPCGYVVLASEYEFDQAVADCKVSRKRTAATRPDAQVIAAITHIAPARPKTSAVTPANSAPTA